MSARRAEHMRLRALSAIVGCVAVAIGLLPAAAHAAEVPASHSQLFTLEGEIREPGHMPIPPPEGGFEDACGVAVDSEGDIYIADYFHHAVDVFNSSREYLTQIADSDVDGPCNLAVDSSGDVYVNNWRRDVVRYAPSHYPPSTATTYGAATVVDFPKSTGARSTGLALDPQTGTLYVDDRTYVAAYEASSLSTTEPEPARTIGLGVLGQGYGIAVSNFFATAGELYVPDAATATVKVFNPSGALLEEVDGAGTPQRGFVSLVDSAAAIDPTNGHLFVADDTEPGFESSTAVVDEFNAIGAYRGQLPPASDAKPSALAVDAAGNVYMTTGNTENAALLVFGPTFAADGLEITKAGSGEGTVTSEPDGINCGTACAAEYNAGTEVTLTAVPSPGSTFTGWNGASGCSLNRTCHVPAGGDVIAEFEALPQQTLTVTKDGAGDGIITSSPVGINCAATCEAEFNEGDMVTLNAEPAALGSVFRGWSVSGDPTACPGTGTCEVRMSEAKSVRADFAPLAVHSLSIEVSGAGAVSSKPAGIDCGGTCEAEYNQGTEVALTATPRPHQTFTGWTGAGCFGTGVCELEIGADTSLNAHFSPTTRSLVITKTGSGSGSISSDPAGIDCGPSCSALYEDGRQVALHATPAPGSAFTGWSGAGCSGTGVCLLVLGADSSVSAGFAQISESAHAEIAASVARLTLGSVASSPNGAGATLALTVPAPGSLLATGKGLKRAKAKVVAPGAATLALALSGTGRKALQKAWHHRLNIKVTVTFTPSGGGAALTSTKLVIFRAHGKSKGEAELAETGDLFATFDGGITPGALPRRRLAPISVLVSGTVTTLSGAEPPALRRISIALSRDGRLDTRGLPVCHLAQIRSTSSTRARAVCSTALVGAGSYAANTAFPEQAGFPFRGHILAFNSISHGHHAILVHVYGTHPSPTTRIIVFGLHHTAGTYGTVLTGELPPAVNRYGYLKSLSLSLHRVFTYRGVIHSYISAACAAPSGFSGAVFPFARATMTFDDGRTLSGTLTRTCTVSR